MARLIAASPDLEYLAVLDGAEDDTDAEDLLGAVRGHRSLVGADFDGSERISVALRRAVVENKVLAVRRRRRWARRHRLVTWRSSVWGNA